MNKKLLALAVAGAFVSPVAMADASVYGQVGMSVNVVNDGAASSGTSNNLSSNQSRIGVKGSEDLGGGLSAIVQLEGTIGPDEATGPVFSRNTFLGLKSNDMGTLLVGNYDTAYKMSTRRLDVFADTMADNRGVVGTASVPANANAGNGSGLMGTGHDQRWTNAIAYASPAMNGFSVAVTSRFGAEGATSSNTKGTAFSLSGMYEQGPIYATLALQNIKYGDGAGLLGTSSGKAKDDESKALKLGGGYTMDAITANAVFEQLTDKTAIGGAEVKGTNVYLGGKFAISATDAVKLAYTKRGETSGNNPVTKKATQVALGYDHGMSKNTSVYALYTKKTDDATNAADPSVISLGMQHKF